MINHKSPRPVGCSVNVLVFFHCTYLQDKTIKIPLKEKNNAFSMRGKANLVKPIKLTVKSIHRTLYCVKLIFWFHVWPKFSHVIVRQESNLMQSAPPDQFQVRHSGMIQLPCYFWTVSPGPVNNCLKGWPSDQNAPQIYFTKSLPWSSNKFVAIRINYWHLIQFACFMRQSTNFSLPLVMVNLNALINDREPP